MLPELRIYTTPSDLKYILFEHPDVISDQIKINGAWNPHVLDKANSILKNSKPGNVIDVGAGFGSFAVPLATSHYNNHRFLSFEPLRIVNLQLSTNVLLNHLDNVKVINAGLGNKNDSVVYYTVDYSINGNHGAFSFDDETNKRRGILPTETLESYQFRTLDSYSPTDVRLIKLSAPGMEREVLEGAKQTISNNDLPPVIFEEWNVDWYAEKLDAIVALLKEYGYQEFETFGGFSCAFKDLQSKFTLLRNDQRPAVYNSFDIDEKPHNTAETLKDQKPLII